MDSELSEFELVLLEAHLKRCDDCRTFGQTITGLTETLRAAPLESPSVSFQPPRIRTRFDVLLTGALRAGSAAAVVAVVALTSLIAFNGSSSGIPAGDIEQARSLLGLHERQLQQIDVFGSAQTPEVPRGLAAAERVGMPAATSSRRRQGRR